MLFDSHCHLNDPLLYSKIEDIILQSKQVGVNKFLIVGYDYSSSLTAIEIANKYKECYASIGIHPTEIDSILKEDIDLFFSLLKEEKVVAVGEIGLDYHWQKENDLKKRQKEWFVKQINYANKYNKPIIVHSRDADEDTFKILKENIVNKKGVLHCFSMSKEMMKEFVKMDFYIGLDGPITFKNAKVPVEVCEAVPLERLLLETDCPYLTPTPYRGKENSPFYLPLIAKKVSEIKKISLFEVEKATYNNTIRLFGIKDE